jgi:exonuclease SbcD
MINLLYVGDPHFRGTNPRNRKDDYKAAWILKMQEVFDLVVKHQCKAVIFPGDLLDTPIISDGLKMELSGMLSRQQVDGVADVFNRCPVDIYTTVGNHELTGYNLTTYQNSSLRVLEALTPKLHVIKDSEASYFSNALFKDSDNIKLTFTPYSGLMDVDGYGYEPGPLHPSNTGVYLNIHVSHGMALDHVPPFDRYSLIQRIETTADLILTGHDHTGYGIYHRPDGKVFVNEGSLTRISASLGEMTRQIKVSLITVGEGPYTGACGTKFGVKSIRLECQRPGAEVLDRSEIEAAQQREYAMEEFTALIKTSTGEKVTVNINQVIEQVAEKGAFAPDVVDLVLKKIETCRMQKEGVI